MLPLPRSSVCRHIAPSAQALVVSVVGFALLLAACGSKAANTPAETPSPCPTASAPAPSPAGGGPTVLTFTNPSGSPIKLSVRVEATEPARERGLMCVAKLPEDQGDLFAWPDVAPNQDVLAPFWMKDTLIPLSIAFISADGHILEEQDMQAQSEARHVPRQPYRYAVEANLGWFFRHGLSPGSTVDLPAAIQSDQPH